MGRNMDTVATEPSYFIITPVASSQYGGMQVSLFSLIVIIATGQVTSATVAIVLFCGVLFCG